MQSNNAKQVTDKNVLKSTNKLLREPRNHFSSKQAAKNDGTKLMTPTFKNAQISLPSSLKRTARFCMGK